MMWLPLLVDNLKNLSIPILVIALMLAITGVMTLLRKVSQIYIHLTVPNTLIMPTSDSEEQHPAFDAAHLIGSQEQFSTQLDLARAYLEMGNDEMAIKLLVAVKAHGDINARQEAHVLLSRFTTCKESP